jgi:hypothetical protein
MNIIGKYELRAPVDAFVGSEMVTVFFADASGNAMAISLPCEVFGGMFVKTGEHVIRDDREGDAGRGKGVGEGDGKAAGKGGRPGKESRRARNVILDEDVLAAVGRLGRPSARELVAEMGLVNPQQIYRRLKALEEAGKLTGDTALETLTYGRGRGQQAEMYVRRWRLA